MYTSGTTSIVMTRPSNKAMSLGFVIRLNDTSTSDWEGSSVKMFVDRTTERVPLIVKVRNLESRKIIFISVGTRSL